MRRGNSLPTPVSRNQLAHVMTVTYRRRFTIVQKLAKINSTSKGVSGSVNAYFGILADVGEKERETDRQTDKQTDREHVCLMFFSE